MTLRKVRTLAMFSLLGDTVWHAHIVFSFSSSAGRRLDHFGDLFLPHTYSQHSHGSSSNNNEPGLSLSSDSDSSNSPPEQQHDLSLPDLHKPDMDSFNDFLIGIGKEYDVDGSAGFHFASAGSDPHHHRPDDFHGFLNEPSAFATSSYDPPSTFAHAPPPAAQTASVSQHSLYPSLAGLSELNAAHPAYKHGNPLPPSTLSGEFAPQATFRRVDRLMAAPPLRGQLTEEPEEMADASVVSSSDATSRTTSSMRSTFDQPQRRRFSMESDTSAGEDVSLPAIRPQDEHASQQQQVLPPLRSVPALQQALRIEEEASPSSSSSSAASRPRTSERMARITSGVDDLRLRQQHHHHRSASSSHSSSESTSVSTTPRTHHLSDSEDEKSPLPHKRSRTRASSLEPEQRERSTAAAAAARHPAVDAETRQRRLMVLKTLAILSNHLFRLSMLPREDVLQTPKAEVPPDAPAAPMAAAA